jgi:hypothetical protein
VYAYWGAAVHGAAWPGTTPQAMPAENLFPPVVQSMQLRPEFSRQTTAMATATVTPRPRVLLGRQTWGLVTVGSLVVITDIADANIQAAPKTVVQP